MFKLSSALALALAIATGHGVPPTRAKHQTEARRARTAADDEKIQAAQDKKVGRLSPKARELLASIKAALAAVKQPQ